MTELRSARSAASVALVGASGSDDALVERIRAGDARAFESLYLSVHGALYGLAMSYLDAPAAAEDLVQDILCRLWRQREQWAAPGGVRAYLYAAVRNGALNELRRHRSEQRWQAAVAVGDTESGMSASPEASDQRVRAGELARAIAGAIERLPERCREAYRLRWQHQLTNPEIARVMGISVKGVEGRLAVALQRLRTELDGFL